MPLPRNLRFPILNAHPIRTTRTQATTLVRPFSHRTPVLVSSDYGSGAGDPKGENPQDQGANPSADKEHPGPAAPKAGHGSGGGPTKGTAEGHNTTTSSDAPASSSSSSGGGQKRGFATSVRRMAKEGEEKTTTRTREPEPKILKDSPPQEASEEVRRHNEEFAKRYDKPHAKVTEADPEKERVGKGFWTGHAGDKESK